MSKKEINITEEKTYPTTKIVGSTRTIDWESVRIQAAIASMQGFLSRQTYRADLTTLVKDSVKLENYLIEELKVKENEI